MHALGSAVLGAPQVKDSPNEKGVQARKGGSYNRGMQKARLEKPCIQA